MNRKRIIIIGIILSFVGIFALKLYGRGKAFSFRPGSGQRPPVYTREQTRNARRNRRIEQKRKDWKDSRLYSRQTKNNEAGTYQVAISTSGNDCFIVVLDTKDGDIRRALRVSKDKFIDTKDYEKELLK